MLSPLLLVALPCLKSVIGYEYRITTASEFYNFVNNVNDGTSYSSTTIFLESDLSLGSLSSPIGYSSSYQFAGTFDGQGHIISDFAVSSSYKYLGLFGYSTGLTIKNVVLSSSCSVYSIYSSQSYVGGFIGYCYSSYSTCNILNSVNMASVTYAYSGSNSYNLYLGGISGYLGYSSYDIYVKNCANYGVVSNSAYRSYSYIGGIAGFLESSGYKYIYNCLNYGKISNSGTTTNSLYLGGIAGYSYYTYFKNCLSAGTISYSSGSTSYVGSFIGYVSSDTNLYYCYFTSNTGISGLYGYTSSSPSITSTPTSSTGIATAVSNLNSYTVENSWNKWLANSGAASVTFKINNYNTFSLSVQAIIFPDLDNTGSNTFEGWFIDTTHSSIFASQEVSINTSFYGIYGVIVTISFNTSKGAMSQRSKDVVYGDVYGDLPTPARAGNTFNGWYTEASVGSQVTPSTQVSTSKNHTLYAHWTPNNYTVSFDTTGGTMSQTSKEVVYDDVYGDLPTPEKDGFNFDGWYTEASGGSKVTSSTQVSTAKNHVLYARWAVGKYNVTFYFDNGAKPETRSFDFNSSIKYPDVPEKEGHTFDGWGENYTEVMPAYNIVVTAQWIVNKYNVTFIIIAKNWTVIIKEVYFNEGVAYPESPEREGFIFIGWDQIVTKMPARDINVTAQWIDTKKNNTMIAIIVGVTVPMCIIIITLIVVVMFLFIRKRFSEDDPDEYYITPNRRRKYTNKHPLINKNGDGNEDGGEDYDEDDDLTASRKYEFNPVDDGDDGINYSNVVSYEYEDNDYSGINNEETIDLEVPISFNNDYGNDNNDDNNGDNYDDERSSDGHFRAVAALDDDFEGTSAGSATQSILLRLYPPGYTRPTMKDALLKADLTTKQTKLICSACENAARLAADDGRLFENFTADDAAAIAMYTYDFGSKEFESNPYRIINKSLADRNYAALQRASGLLYLVLTALRKLSRVTGITLYRGVRGRVNKDNYKKGNIVTWMGMSSTSPDMDATRKFLLRGSKTGKSTGTLFIIEEGWGYNIQQYSLFSDEAEVLLEPDRQFRVISVLAGELTIINLQMLDTPITLPQVFGSDW